MHHILKAKQSTNSVKLPVAACTNRIRAVLARSTRNWIQMAALFVLVSLSGVAHAAKDPIYTSLLSNKAVGGYDTVSYFQGDGKPVKGDNKFSYEYKGAEWLFSSQANLDAFKQDPEKYAPKYGGYCAYAVANNATAKGDPLQYHIHEGKLYLNVNAKFAKIWVDDKINYIEKSEKFWPSVLN